MRDGSMIIMTTIADCSVDLFSIVFVGQVWVGEVAKQI